MFPSINKDVSSTAPMTLETIYQPRDDSDDILALTAGTETFCSHLSQMSQMTGLDGIDGQATVWQCNWAFASVVGKNQDLLTNDGSKLWMSVLAEDVSGAVTFRMGEKVALQLSGLAKKEDFLRAVKDGDPVFPTVTSLKASRKVKRLPPSCQDSGDAPSLTVNMQIVDACPQDFGLTRTQSVMDLVPIMKSFKSLTSAIMPATMAMLTSSTIYPLCVRYLGMDAQPCNKAWVLLKTTTKSVWLEEPPYTVTTDGVQDALDTSQAHSLLCPWQLKQTSLHCVCHLHMESLLTHLPSSPRWKAKLFMRKPLKSSKLGMSSLSKKQCGKKWL
jgi:hypothetical protein